MKRQKICVVTGTRAEYGLLYWPMMEIKNSGDFELQVIATGMHLSPEFGLTYKAIEQDGFKIDAKVDMLLSGDTPVCIAKSMGVGTMGMAEALDRLQPDLLMLLGDRFELLAAAQAALVARLPMAHLFGGDTTEGAYDESIRHSLTKMSHLHFVTNEISARRVRQMGEDPNHIFNVGSPGLDHLTRTEILSREELSKSLNFEFQNKNFLVTYHPETWDRRPASDLFAELLTALEEFKDVGLIFTLPNADNEGRGLIQMIHRFVENHSRAKAFASLGQARYLSAIKAVDAVIGNSSSGIYEVPSFQKPTINIGRRQFGRLQASSVINCEPRASEIVKAIKRGLELNLSVVKNPYGDGDSSSRIIKELQKLGSFKNLGQKHFFMLENRQ